MAAATGQESGGSYFPHAWRAAARPGPDTGLAARDCCAARGEQGRHARLRPGVGGIQSGVSVTESCLLNVTFDICSCGDVMSPAWKGAD